MKRKIISIFLILLIFTTLFGVSASPRYTVSAEICRYEIETYGGNVERIHFIVRDGVNVRLDQMALKLKSMGFSDSVVLRYLFTNYEDVIKSLETENIEVVNSEFVVDNGRVYPTHESSGKALEVEKLDSMIVSKVLNNEPFLRLPFRVVEPTSTYSNNLLYCNLKSHFTTPIRGVNQEGRIHNITEALSRFNGMKIEPNEVVSFNKIIGDTTKENGYALAKVIINGKYEDDYGGGVCQAATTLYNALLLADIEVLEANPHSLRVGYVESSFDSMVSLGISDLVFKNNTSGPIFISTYCDAVSCGATIYGIENEYDIRRRSENIDFDAEKFPKISQKSEGYLEYYKGGVKLFEKKIRKDNYYKLKTNEE